jgi:hypothetical protein
VILFVVMGVRPLDHFGDEPLDQANAETQLVGNTGQVSRLDLRHLHRPVRGRLGAAARRPHRGHRRWRGGLIVDDLLLNQFLLLGAILFCIGVYGVLARATPCSC